MKGRLRRTVLLLILCIFFIYLVDIFTINPNVYSGNGNLGLLFLFPALIIFIFFAHSFWVTLGNLHLSSKSWKVIFLGSLFLLLLFCFLEYTFVLQLIDTLGGTPKIETSKIYRYPWVNQYTNTFFVNYFTFIMMITGVTLLRSIMRMK
ncbi:hypothetical protein JOC75_000946 [Metabacillus crassostreae]|uniref:hypothetical protein n=1 Tax=Metabacillus crassostreae TaxID=929098 RepID=UPI00195D61CD|nr:hypothetical protein [Metabacillus crassostreae]MBM7602976.1 hypothetical protein [Metabacillus crassostreae]